MNKTDLDALARNEQNEYARNWRKNNRDRVREINRKYWRNRALKKLDRNNKKEGDSHD